MTDEEIQEIFKGYDAMVYRLGPDDRVIPKAPAYEFFHQFLVEQCGRIVADARIAGVKKCVVLSSYFCYFDRLWPELHLSNRHVYIKCRNEQAERVIKGGRFHGGLHFGITVYFWCDAETTRVPLWKDVLFVAFTKNESCDVHQRGIQHDQSVEHVGEAIVGEWKMGNTGKDIRWGMKMSTGRI